MSVKRIDKSYRKILVIVPHEDDELLMAAGILYQAVKAGVKVGVVIVTNGDYEGDDFSAGRERMNESLRGLKLLGVSQDNVYFCGYADTGMDKASSFLNRLLEEKNGEKIVSSRCSCVTYGLSNKPDYHTQTYGEGGKYNRNTLYADIKEILQKEAAEHIFTTSEFDVHGDHSALYHFVAEALKELKVEKGYRPKLYAGLVHSPAGDDKWPPYLDTENKEIKCLPCPPDWENTIPWKWEERIQFMVPDCMLKKELKENLKYQAIEMHKSALKPDAINYLHSFVKADEVFFEIKEDTAIYPVDEWRIIETEFQIENNYRNETTFALSNGYIGTRGTFEEGYDFDEKTGLEGNFLNGFYESEEIRYGEWNFGFPTQSQSLLNIPNAKKILLYLGNEKFDMRTGKIHSYERILHMDKGFLERIVTWESPEGKIASIKIKRFVSLKHRNQMMISYEVTPLNFNGEITFSSQIEADVCNHTRTANPLVDYGPFGKHLTAAVQKYSQTSLYYEGKTSNSGLYMACGCEHKIRGEKLSCGSKAEEESLETVIKMNARLDEPICLEKYIVYFDWKEEANAEAFIQKELMSCTQKGFAEALSEQEKCMADIWQGANINIEGETSLVQGLRFNLFHIFQAPGNDGKTGMGAKGLSGEGYEGHYFWDTEMYVLPVFVFTNPQLARKLLEYRYNTLKEARVRARELGHEKGALYPWRTINGKEASTYFPLGTAQYHINADVAYAVNLYWQATGDVDFVKKMGAEILWETARVWADVGCFAESRGNKYCICAVTGPDEYNAIVDNNFYTNLMARENLYYALEMAEFLHRTDEKTYKQLADKINLKEEELDLWRKIADNMYFAYDEKEKIYFQDDGFMMRKPWDDSKIPEEKRHLLYENYHPLFIFRQRMSKQADAIMGLFLCRHLYDKEILKKNYNFYQSVTLHHSSLSTCIFGMLASEIGYEEDAYQYFMQSARMDLDDYHKNFYAGIHAANMAGTWQALVFGFAGINMVRGELYLRPCIPKQWKGYSFSIRYRGRMLTVSRHKDIAKISLAEGESLTLHFYDKTITLAKGEEYETV